MSDILKQFSKAQSGLVTQQSDFSLQAIFDMITHSSIDISPNYQRRDRWSIDKQSALIESFLLNVPVPPVYLSEDDYGTYSVIDGKQRLTAVFDFLSGKFKLRDLVKFPSLNGFTYAELPKQMQNALIVRPFIRVITLLQQSDPELKYEVFLRLNTGGEKLTPQEIRNVAYSGPFNDLIMELSGNVFLRQQMKIKDENSASYRSMEDVEMVLRFFSLSEKWEYFGEKLAPGLDNFMSRNRRVNVEPFRVKFQEAINRCFLLWGNRAFQKPVGDGWREQFIAPLYDAQMIVATELSEHEFEYLKSNPEISINILRDLFNNRPDFVKSVTQATSDSSQIKMRVTVLLDHLREACPNV